MVQVYYWVKCILIPIVHFFVLQANVLDFMYNGEVKLTQCHIKAFLSLAEELQIKGLNNQKASSILAATLKRSLPGKPNHT